MKVHIIVACALFVLVGIVPVWVSFVASLFCVLLLRTPFFFLLWGISADIFYGLPLWLGQRSWATLAAIILTLIFYFIRTRTRPLYV